jgi:hypothetical protein
MPMRDGKLVWSHNERTKTWYVHAHDDEDIIYVARPEPGGGWSLEVQRRLAESNDLGWHKKLSFAKAAADKHHRARILMGDDEDLKEYIRRCERLYS